MAPISLGLFLAAPASGQPSQLGPAPTPPPGAVAPGQTSTPASAPTPSAVSAPPEGYPAVSTPPAAPAAAETDLWGSRFALLGHVGIGTPTGFLGVGAEAAALRWLVFEGGLGLGPNGPEVAGLMRLRGTFFHSTALGVGTGLSAGSYEWHEGPFVDNPAVKRAKPGYFGNVEIVLEHRAGTEQGFQMRELLGYAFILNPGDLQCVQEISHCQKDHTNDGKKVLFLGMSFGYYFF
jgi:hypothetical protein